MVYFLFLVPIPLVVFLCFVPPCLSPIHLLCLSPIHLLCLQGLISYVGLLCKLHFLFKLSFSHHLCQLLFSWKQSRWGCVSWSVFGFELTLTCINVRQENQSSFRKRKCVCAGKFSLFSVSCLCYDGHWWWKMLVGFNVAFVWNLHSFSSEESEALVWNPKTFMPVKPAALLFSAFFIPFHVFLCLLCKK